MSQAVFNPYLFATLPYDPRRDLVPIAKLVATSFVLAANPSLGVDSLAQIVALSQREPDRLLIGVPANGSPPHIAAILLLQKTGLKARFVPFRSGPDALSSAIRGDIHLLVDGPTLIAPQVKDRKLKALAVTGHERQDALADVPTLAEAGFKDAECEVMDGAVRAARHAAGDRRAAQPREPRHPGEPGLSRQAQGAELPAAIHLARGIRRVHRRGARALVGRAAQLRIEAGMSVEFPAAHAQAHAAMRAAATPQDRMLALQRMINGYQLSQAIGVAATLGIADLLAGGARTSAELASHTGSHPPTLHRLLRALAAAGLFHEDAERRFSLTWLGEGLRDGVPGSRRGWARYSAGHPAWLAWGQLLHSVQTGENAFRRAHGVDVWRYRAENASESVLFDAAMRESSEAIAACIAGAYDFAGLRGSSTWAAATAPCWRGSSRVTRGCPAR